MDENHLKVLHEGIQVASRKVEAVFRSERVLDLSLLLNRVQAFKLYVESHMPSPPPPELKQQVYDALLEVQRLVELLSKELSESRRQLSQLKQSYKVQTAYSFGVR